MSRVFHEGQPLFVPSQIAAHFDPAIDSSVKYLQANQDVAVTSYNQKGTEGSTQDDFVQVRVTEGPQKEQTFWVPFSEFSKLHKI